MDEKNLPESWKSRANASPISNARKAQIVREIASMMASWHRRPSEESELFLRNLEYLFGCYPPSVTAAVTSPITGIQTRPEFLEFMPSHGHIKRALDHEKEIFDRSALRERAKRISRASPDTAPDALKRPLDLEKYADLIGPGARSRARHGNARPSGFRSLADIAQECGVTKEQIDAMPNNPALKGAE